MQGRCNKGGVNSACDPYLSPDNIRSEVMGATELQEEPEGPQVVGLIIVHSSVVHYILLCVCMVYPYMYITHGIIPSHTTHPHTLPTLTTLMRGLKQHSRNWTHMFFKTTLREEGDKQLHMRRETNSCKPWFTSHSHYLML